MESRPFGSGGSSGKDNLSLFHGSLPGAVYLPLPLMYSQMNSCPMMPNPLLPFPASMLSQHGFSHQVASVLSSSGSLLLNQKQHQQQQQALHAAAAENKDGFGLLHHLQDHHHRAARSLAESGVKGSPYDFTLQGRPFFPSALHHFRCAEAESDLDAGQGRPISSLSRSACTLSAAGSEPSCSPSSCTDEKGMLMGDKGDDANSDDPSAASTTQAKIEDLVADYKRETPWNVRDHFPSRCPVCGVSISPADLAPHFRTELESLTEFHKNREWMSVMDLPSPEMGSPKAAFHDSFRFTSRLSDRKPPLSRWEMFLRVRLNRQNRISAARGRTRRRSGDMMELCETKHEEMSEDSKQLDRASAMSSVSEEPLSILRSCSDSVHGWNTAQEAQHREASDSEPQNYTARAPSASEVTTTSADNEAADVKVSTDEDDKCSNAASRSPEELIELLQKRLRDLEANPGLCPICRSVFEKPVVSVGCWHVHCEKCWLQVLGSSKRLCPRCGVMTTPGDLRRIHL